MTNFDSTSSFLSLIIWLYAHLCELRRRSAGNLLCAQLPQLGLQLAQLLVEVVLALGPELASLDFTGRLWHAVLAFETVHLRSMGLILTIMKGCREYRCRMNSWEMSRKVQSRGVSVVGENENYDECVP